jgi:hypothetical protein
MENFIPRPELKKTKEPRVKLRAALILALFLIIIALAIWIGKMYSENQRARNTLGAERKVQQELERCNGLLSQGSGAFDEYEYCRQFTEIFNKYQAE